MSFLPYPHLLLQLNEVLLKLVFNDRLTGF